MSVPLVVFVLALFAGALAVLVVAARQVDLASADRSVRTKRSTRSEHDELAGTRPEETVRERGRTE